MFSRISIPTGSRSFSSGLSALPLFPRLFHFPDTLCRNTLPSAANRLSSLLALSRPSVYAHRRDSHGLHQSPKSNSPLTLSPSPPCTRIRSACAPCPSRCIPLPVHAHCKSSPCRLASVGEAASPVQAARVLSHWPARFFFLSLAVLSLNFLVSFFARFICFAWAYRPCQTNAFLLKRR